MTGVVMGFTIQRMRIVSLVPSWTETLIEADAHVIGRTRFCIHPATDVKTIPALGGTKDLDLGKLQILRPDLLVLDQEENLPWMKEQSPVPVHVSHITSIGTMGYELRALADVLRGQDGEEGLRKMGARWDRVNEAPNLDWDFENIPGQKSLIQKQKTEYQHVIYVIWKNPWMTVAKHTFIGSVLMKLGLEVKLLDFSQKYPAFELEKCDLKNTFFLFSSEPFPFHKQLPALKELGLDGAVVDGEPYSWFGIRSLLFLEKALGLKI